MKHKIMTGIIGLFGLVHAVYGLIMFSESLLYGVMWLSIGFVELCIASFSLYLKKTRPKLAAVLSALVVVWLAVQVVLSGVIMAGSLSFNTAKADKVIVLGYALKDNRATDTLFNRISEAYEYAEDNPDSKLIVTGGVTGKNDKSEAEVMKSILVSYGIDSIRVFEEDQAKSTIENMRFCQDFIAKDDKVVVITSNYHCLRAKTLAKKMGYSVKTIGASAPLKLLMNQLFLEKISLIQILLFGV